MKEDVWLCDFSDEPEVKCELVVAFDFDFLEGAIGMISLSLSLQ